ncbi:MAG TPA: SMP-30/gluconolactonase/LRE family protein [Cyclobacteriaceae bacterium]|nr:SMP-30/gluconolactonase/LRE family protein [Cyclobacteriaceae bacterium]HRJ82143.1 SMP-30/gluconolactonase/LRE family protein [Cyclobacteriaceae bacterium]
MRLIFFPGLLLIVIIGCNPAVKKTIGSIERLDAALDNIISIDAQIEILAEGFEWSEGPVWVESENMLLFSDVPKNMIHKWTEANGLKDYLTPSGFTGTETERREPGSNGLVLDGTGKLVLCQHGDRRIAVLNASLADPKPEFSTLADRYDGKKFNSPNDAAFRGNDLFFTDPPYGLPKQANDPTKEIPFQGVYKVSAAGDVTLMIDSLTRPNGIAFFPDNSTFIVANSDPGKAIWYRYRLDENDSIVHASIFYDATENTKTESGLPDGLKIDQQGNVFATGPGGVWIFSSDGKALGKIKLPVPTANCALSADQKTLYITADMYLLRVKLQ